MKKVWLAVVLVGAFTLASFRGPAPNVQAKAVATGYAPIVSIDAQQEIMALIPTCTAIISQQDGAMAPPHIEAFTAATTGNVQRDATMATDATATAPPGKTATATALFTRTEGATGDQRAVTPTIGTTAVDTNQRQPANTTSSAFTCNVQVIARDTGVIASIGSKTGFPVTGAAATG